MTPTTPQKQTRPDSAPTTVVLTPFLRLIEAAEAAPGKDGVAASAAYDVHLVLRVNAADLPRVVALVAGNGTMTLHGQPQRGPTLVSA